MRSVWDAAAIPESIAPDAQLFSLSGALAGALEFPFRSKTTANWSRQLHLQCIGKIGLRRHRDRQCFLRQCLQRSKLVRLVKNRRHRGGDAFLRAFQLG
jgi:hypothetical protein